MENEWFEDVRKEDIFYNFDFMYSRYKKKRVGYIYFLRCGEYYKVGRAKHLNKRLSAYVTHSPYEIETIMTLEVDDYVYFEELLHKTFSNFIHRGEWYLFSNHALNIIKELLKKYVETKNDKHSILE